MNITSNKIILNIPKQNLSDDASTRPLNPVELREYKQSEDSFLKSGKEDYFNIVKKSSESYNGTPQNFVIKIFKHVSNSVYNYLTKR